MTVVLNRKPGLRPRKRCYRADMRDDHGGQYTFFFTSSNIASAWRTGMAEADAKFLSLDVVEYISIEEFISQTEGV